MNPHLHIHDFHLCTLPLLLVDHHLDRQVRVAQVFSKERGLRVCRGAVMGFFVAESLADALAFLLREDATQDEPARG